jgi:large subunit ribosomal protein L15
MKLNQLKPPKGSKHHRKRIGRGDSSGHGGTSTKGHKGHKARSGYTLSFNFEGGQMPLMRRLPKRGFTSRKKKNICTVSLDSIEKNFAENDVVTLEKMAVKRWLKKGKLIKVLGTGKITKNMEIHAHSFSGKAKEKIEKSGGKAVIEKI